MNDLREQITKLVNSVEREDVLLYLLRFTERLLNENH